MVWRRGKDATSIDTGEAASLGLGRAIGTVDRPSLEAIELMGRLALPRNGSVLGPDGDPIRAKVGCGATSGGSTIMSIGLKRDRVLRDDRGQTIASATRTLQLEAEGLSALKAALAGDLIDSFAQAIEILRSCRGRVIVTGMGKSGHVGLKVAATLSSTGSPAFSCIRAKRATAISA